MIWRPKAGQRVVLRYNARARSEAIHIGNLHNQHGRVLTVGKGAKMVNTRVRLDSGEVVTLPRGNLFEEEKR